MSDVLGSITLPCSPTSAGGIVRVWAALRADFGRFYFAQTSHLQYGTVTGSETDGVFYPLYAQPVNAALATAEETQPSRSYTVSLSLPYNRMDVTHRDVFERLATVNAACFVAEDRNGQLWLVGEAPDGCRFVTGYNSQARGAVGQYALTATARQTWPLRTVDTDWFGARVAGGSPSFAAMSITNLQATGISALSLLQ
jgi:hypothetical protein